MRATYVVIVSIVLGAALGATVSWAHFHDAPPLPVHVPSAGPQLAARQGHPKVLVDSRNHDFGAVEHDTKVTHVFQITNLGDAPLVLKAGSTSCTRCTIAELEKSRLEPGETCGVKVEYRATYSQPKFRQHARVVTNDPDQKIVELNITGVVKSRYIVLPQYLVLSKISAKESKTAQIRVYDFIADEVGVEKYELTGQETAKFFEVSTHPIPRDQLAEPGARSGCRVVVTVKPGLPIGPIRQTIRLELKLAGSDVRPVVDVPVEGTVDSDISIVGRDWNADAGRLLMGAVPSGQGATRNLFLMVRGPHRHDTTIKPAKIDPPWLKVTLGEPRELKTGAQGEGGVTQIPLAIEIPPGAPPVNRLGSDQGKYAEVTFETTHPDATKIRMYVQFVVTQ